MNHFGVSSCSDATCQSKGDMKKSDTGPSFKGGDPPGTAWKEGKGSDTRDRRHQDKRRLHKIIQPGHKNPDETKQNKQHMLAAATLN